LHTHKLARPQTDEARLEAFAKASEWHVNIGMVKAKSLYAVAKAQATAHASNPARRVSIPH
jgi:hypothetical protein